VIRDAVDTVVCAPDDGWKYHPKHVEQFPDINKLCNVASCWVYEYIGILLGAHPILHISRIRVKHVIQACGAVVILSTHLLNLGADGGEWSASCHIHFTPSKRSTCEYEAFWATELIRIF
jgi:hypothetical protein